MTIMTTTRPSQQDRAREWGARPMFTPAQRSRDGASGRIEWQNVVLCGTVPGGFVRVALSEEDFRKGRYWAVSPDSLRLPPEQEKRS